MKNYFQMKHVLFFVTLLFMIIGGFYPNPTSTKVEAGCAITDPETGRVDTGWPPPPFRINHGWCRASCTAPGEISSCWCDAGYHRDPSIDIQNGDLDLLCVSNTTVELSGTLSPDISTCTIPRGASMCNPGSTLTWTTSNPPAGSTTSITIEGETGTVATGYNGSQAVSIPHTAVNTFKKFILKNGTTTLDTALVDAVCETGATWNGTTCAGATLPDLTATIPPQTTAIIGVPQTFTSIITNNQI